MARNSPRRWPSVCRAPEFQDAAVDPGRGRILEMPVEPPGILLLAELYPPTIGGSGVLLESLYSRLPNHRVHVITDGTGSRVQRGVPVTGVRMSARDWGVLGRGCLARHVRIAREVRRLTSGDVIVHCGRGLPEGLSAALS